VTLKAGRRSSFEVTFGDEVIHSKLDSGEWPDTEAVLEALAARFEQLRQGRAQQPEAVGPPARPPASGPRKG
jgi:hypothetical protein